MEVRLGQFTIFCQTETDLGFFHSSPLELPMETRRFSGEFEGEVEDFVYLDDIDLGLTGVTTNTSQSHIFPSARALTASAS